MPIGPYQDFDDCVAKNRDKDDPSAYCASIERAIKGDAAVESPPGEEFHAMLVIEGTWTGDGRWIDEGALTWRTLPLPIMAIDRTTEGHYDALLIGSIDRIERQDREIHAWGRFVPNPDGEAARLQQLIRDGFLSGVSVDLDAMEYELVMPSEIAASGALAEHEGECPPATTDVAVNLKARQHAIDTAAYGPLNPDEPNDEFWRAKGDLWGVGPEEARKQRCGNCAAFIQTPAMLECIASGLAEGDSEGDAWDVVEAGDLGYCESFDFKCAAARTCDAWIVGGPVTEEEPEDEPGVEIEIEVGQAAEEEAPMLVEEARMRITAARIMGATVVPFPAFQEAFIESLPALVASLATSTATGYVVPFSGYSDLDFTPPAGARQEAERGLAWRAEYGRGGTAVGVARARDIKNGVSLSPETVTRMRSYFARHEVDQQGEGWRPGEDGYPSAGRIAWALWGGDPGRAWAEKLGRQMAARDREGSTITASAALIDAPVAPPREWFADPRLSGPTPIRVDDSGRVSGHLAVWGQCHIGFSDSCVTPPRSAARYAHFLTGELVCADGSRVAVGQITMDTGHAPLAAGARSAAAHYDDTGLAVADVAVGEDRYGIWLAGALRPALPGERVRAILAADVSGDWRRVGSSLELVAVLSVNVPGFPKSRVAAREEEGLVAALVAHLGPKDALVASTPSEPREEPVAAPAPQHLASTIDRIARSIGRDARARAAELRARVHGGL